MIWPWGRQEREEEGKGEKSFCKWICGSWIGLLSPLKAQWALVGIFVKSRDCCHCQHYPRAWRQGHYCKSPFDWMHENPGARNFMSSVLPGIGSLEFKLLPTHGFPKRKKRWDMALFPPLSQATWLLQSRMQAIPYSRLVQKAHCTYKFKELWSTALVWAFPDLTGWCTSTTLLSYDKRKAKASVADMKERKSIEVPYLTL